MSVIENTSHLENLKLEEAGDSSSETCVIVSSMAATIEEVSSSIKTVGYQGTLLDEKEFLKSLTDGPKSTEFTKLVSYLTNEIRVLRNLDEFVNPINAPEDSATFIMEISSFLNELGCPYSWLTQGHVSDRFSMEQDKLLLLEYLSVETMMARIHRERNPGRKIELKLHESPQAADLRKILQTFGFSKPPPNITMKTLMQKLIPAIKTAVEKAGPELLGHPILNATLTPKKWDILKGIQEELHYDYHIRRQMLLKRLDCTIQSFQWSNKTKGKEDLLNQIYTSRRKQLKLEPDIDISDLLAARDDLAIIEKTSSASVRKNTKSSINSVIIGQVPDRGGRTSEQAPPPPEMPPWQQRNTGPASSGGGFRGGRGGGTNYSRGGGQQSSFSSNNPYAPIGSTFSSGSLSGNSYGKDNSYYKSGDNYKSGSYSTKSSFGTAGSYGRSDSYSQGGGNYSQYDSRQSSNNYSQGSYSSRDSGYSSKSSGGYSQGGNRGAYDSAGSYGGGYSQDPKRPKTYDQYQPNKTSYADQYVQESNRNQQYHARDENRSGRSNYSRGGGSSSYR